MKKERSFVLRFGKYNGRNLSSLVEHGELQYLKWGISEGVFKGNKLKLAVKKHILNNNQPS